MDSISGRHRLTRAQNAEFRRMQLKQDQLNRTHRLLQKSLSREHFDLTKSLERAEAQNKNKSTGNLANATNFESNTTANAESLASSSFPNINANHLAPPVKGSNTSLSRCDSNKSSSSTSKQSHGLMRQQSLQENRSSRGGSYVGIGRWSKQLRTMALKDKPDGCRLTASQSALNGTNEVVNWRRQLAEKLARDREAKNKSEGDRLCAMFSGCSIEAQLKPPPANETDEERPLTVNVDNPLMPGGLNSPTNRGTRPRPGMGPSRRLVRKVSNSGPREKR